MADELTTTLPPPESLAESPPEAPVETAPEPVGADDRGLTHLAALEEIDPELYREIEQAMERAVAESPPEAPAPPVKAPEPSTPMTADDGLEVETDSYDFSQAVFAVESGEAQAKTELEQAYQKYKTIYDNLGKMRENGAGDTPAYQAAEEIAWEKAQAWENAKTNYSNRAGMRQFMGQIKGEIESLPVLKGHKTLYATLRLTGQIANGTPARAALATVNQHLASQGRRPLGATAPLMNNAKGAEKKTAVERLKNLRLNLGKKQSASPGGNAAVKKAEKLPAYLESKLEGFK